MSSSVDRIAKYFDDQVGILSSGKLPKIKSEIQSMRTWLVKHQDESIPEGAKGKIISILEKYNRAATGHLAVIRGPVVQLYGDFLALPEGKLCGTKEKNRVLSWYELLDAGEDASAASGEAGAAAKAPTPTQVPTRWSVQDLVAASSTVTLLSEDDADLWMEDLFVDDKEVFAAIRVLYEAGEGGQGGEADVKVEFDETSRRVVGVLEGDC